MLLENIVRLKMGAFQNPYGGIIVNERRLRKSLKSQIQVDKVVPMYLNHYDLTDKPFSISPDPNFLWPGEKHAEALAGLQYGILENKGFVLLTGEIGTGKTLLINSLVKSINEEVIVATIPDPRLELIDFYNILANKFKMNMRFERKGDFLIHFEEFLIKANSHHKKVF